MPPSVLILGIDSVSRLHMLRSLPKTRRFILGHDFIEMKGYTKIGDNTLPNLMGLLGNMDAENYPCWKGKNQKFDDCPLLWKNFSAKSYITAHIEDAPDLAIFNYAKTGFVVQPTDYYLRSFMIAHSLRPRLENSCIAGLTVTEFILQYIQNFVSQMSLAQVPYFLVSWLTELSHEDFNGIRVGTN